MGDAVLYAKSEERGEEDEKKHVYEPMELDECLDYMKGTSVFQGGLILASILLVVSSCTVTTLPIFLSATPEFRCDLSDVSEPYNLTDISLSKLIPTTSNDEFDSCYRYKFNATRCGSNFSTSCLKNASYGPAEPCNNYVYEDDVYKESITTEWDLVCDRSMLKAIANSCMFFGFFLGSFMTGTLADWFGRKKVMLGTALTTSAFGFAVAYSPSYVFYLVSFTLFSGASIGEYIVAYTYISEICNRKQRTDILLVTTLLGALGDVVISPVAYLFRQWRYIALFCGVVALLYVPTHYFITESPRWLLSHGRHKSARKVIKRYFDSKGVEFNEDHWERVLCAEKRKTQELKRRKKYSTFDLFKTHYVRLLTMNVMFSWFVVAIVYYGLILNIGNLAGDPYLNGFINSLLDIVASSLMMIAVRLVSKVRLFCCSFLLAGIACITSMLVLQSGHEIASVVLACIGRFGAACAYKIAYILTTEVFPTVVRSTGLSLGSGSSRIGGMISPFTVQAQETIPWLMQTVFGSLSILAGIFALAYPDTSNVGLMSTLQETEDFCAENMPRFCRKRKSGIQRRFTSPIIASELEKTEDATENML